MSNIVKTYKMNFFDTKENSNKVWIGMAYANGRFETRFGRVRHGANLQTSPPKDFGSESSAVYYLEQKRREKLRKGYRDTSVLDNESGEIALGSNQSSELSRIAVEQIGGASDSLTRDLIKGNYILNAHSFL
jgi:predicted DNA-binding WGR domain protein